MEFDPHNSDLVCPVTRQTLRPATAAELEMARATFSKNTAEPLTGALVTIDASRAYPVITGIPVLLPDAALPLSPPAQPATL